MRSWRNVILLSPDSENEYNVPIIPVVYVDPVISVPTPVINSLPTEEEMTELQKVLTQISGYESEIANLITDPMPIDISFSNTSLNPVNEYTAPVVPVTYVDPVISTPTSSYSIGSIRTNTSTGVTEIFNGVDWVRYIKEPSLTQKPTTIADTVNKVLDTILAPTTPVTTTTPNNSLTTISEKPVNQLGVGSNIVNSLKNTLDEIFDTSTMNEGDKNTLYLLGAVAGVGILALIFK